MGSNSDLIELSNLQVYKSVRFSFVLVVVNLFLSTSGFGQSREFPWYNSDLSFETRIDLLVSEMTLDEKLSQFNSTSPVIERLGIPEYNWWNEALHGVARNGKATVFPQAIALASTFDPELAERVATAISTEARAKFNIAKSIGNRGKYAGLTFWTPNVNIFRDPRWGRGQETYGEDPLLTSRMGVGFVKGLQGDHPKYLRSAACAKHYAVHSGPEELRHHFNVSPSKKDLYETYLPAFEALVKEGNVEGVMGAYNAVYDEPSCSSDFLINELLRKSWGFEGYIVSDCGALGDIYKGHKKVSSIEDAAALALNTGINLNCGYTYNALKTAYEKGLIDDEIIDNNLRQLYQTRFKLGLFDDDNLNPFASVDESAIHSNENISLAREVAQKSIVLLKNSRNTLPLPKDMNNLYVTGPFAASVDVLIANYYGISTDLVTVLEGIANKVSPGTSLNYRMGALPFHDNINPLNWAPFVAGEVEATICVLGISADMEGEEVDAIASAAKGDRKDLKLPQNQINYFNQLVEKKKGPLVLVIASGSPVSLEGIEDKADAILQIWYPGEQGGNAVADIIFGDVAPSGHLPLTFPASVTDLPPYQDYNMRGRTYKYMDKEVLYPFGFGLSYGSVELSSSSNTTLRLKKSQEINIDVEISNNTKLDLDDVIQVYISPVAKGKGLPYYRLLDFERVEVASGADRSLQFTFNQDDLSYIDDSGLLTWIKGDYEILISNSLPTQKALELGSIKPLKYKIKLK